MRNMDDMEISQRHETMNGDLEPWHGCRYNDTRGT